MANTRAQLHDYNHHYPHSHGRDQCCSTTMTTIDINFWELHVKTAIGLYVFFDAPCLNFPAIQDPRSSIGSTKHEFVAGRSCPVRSPVGPRP